VSTEARAVHFPADDWGGGVRPYRVGHRKLGMWLFIVSDSLTFSALLIGYSYLRASNVWPTPFPFYPSIVFSSVMTFCLLSSSLTMVFGVSASSRGDKAAARKWILATMAFGAAFVILHLIEWNHLITEGLRPFSLPAH
jgi:cytochrome c oxidase subunit 3